MIKTYQKCVGMTTYGTRAIILNSQNEVLLVKHTYTPGWHFPGGGVERGESPRQAVIREIKEEAGIISLQQPEIIDCYSNVYLGVPDIVTLYLIKEFQITPFECNKEIAEVKWFSIENLPADATNATKKRVAEVFFAQPRYSENW